MDELVYTGTMPVLMRGSYPETPKITNMNQAQMEIDHICKWAKVLNVDAYGILLDRLITERKMRSFSGHEGLSNSDIDDIVLDIMLYLPIY